MSQNLYGSCGADERVVGEVPDAVERSVCNVSFGSARFPVSKHPRWDRICKARRAYMHAEEERREDYILRMFTVGKLYLDEKNGLLYLLQGNVRLNFRASEEDGFVYNEGKKSGSNPEVKVTSWNLEYAGYYMGCRCASEAIWFERPDYLRFEGGRLERLLGARTDFNPRFEEMVMRDVFAGR